MLSHRFNRYATKFHIFLLCRTSRLLMENIQNYLVKSLLLNQNLELISLDISFFINRTLHSLWWYRVIPFCGLAESLKWKKCHWEDIIFWIKILITKNTDICSHFLQWVELASLRFHIIYDVLELWTCYNCGCRLDGSDLSIGSITRKTLWAV